MGQINVEKTFHQTDMSPPMKVGSGKTIPPKVEHWLRLATMLLQNPEEVEVEQNEIPGSLLHIKRNGRIPDSEREYGRR